MRNIKNIKPYIGITVADEQNPEIIKEITAGLEEEGVPWELKKTAQGDAISLAYKSAQESTLQVGIAVGENRDTAVHYTPLPIAEPLFFISFTEGTRDLWRILGSNAARLIKGIPFRQGGPKKQWSEKGLEAGTDLEYITAQVTKILHEILAGD